MDEAATIAAVSAGRSLARFGDGELKIALGRPAKSQWSHPFLQTTLLRILQDPLGPAVVGIPNVGRADSPKAAFWAAYGGEKYKALYRADGIYGSSWVTRPDSAPWINQEAYWAAVQGLWAGRDVVLVRGPVKGLRAADMAQAASIVEIVGPAQNAWSAGAQLMAQTRAAAKGGKRVILCLGATATAMAWLLAQEGIHAIDLGHIGMFMRKRAAGAPLEVTDEDRAIA